MGFKGRRAALQAKISSLVGDWMDDQGLDEVHAFRRQRGGVSVLMLVGGDQVEAESGVFQGVQAVIASEIGSDAPDAGTAE